MRAAQRNARLLVGGLLAAMIAVPAAAQVTDFSLEPEVLLRLGVTEEELGQMQEVDTSTRAAKREAQIELEILTARLKRALLPTDPRMREVEELLREAMDWEFRMRLADIRRQIRIRQVLGDERYTRIRELVRRRQEQQRTLAEQRALEQRLQQQRLQDQRLQQQQPQTDRPLRRQSDR